MVIDTLLLMLYISLIFFGLTGIVFHEIAGVVFLVMVIAHIALNRLWVAGVVKQAFNGGLNSKTKGVIFFNAVLLINTTVTIITGLCISQVIFPHYGYLGILPALHKWSAYISLVEYAVHIALHRLYIAGFFKKLRTSANAGKMWGSVSAAGALLLVTAVVYCHIEFGLKAASASISGTGNITASCADSGQNTIYGDKANSKGKKEDAAIQNAQETPEAITLSDYLGKLFCTACLRHCPLLAPKCGRGQIKVQQATINYEETYAVN